MAWKKAALFALVAGVAAGCSRSGGDGAAPVIDLSGGGASNTLVGGQSGGMTIVTPSPGGVAIRRSGAADTAFTVPPWAGTPVDLGTHGVTVRSTTQVIRLAVGGNDPGSGVLYVVAGNTSLFEADGVGTVPVAAEAITGLEVSAGAALRIVPNFDANVDTSLEQVRLAFASDVAVAGTLDLPRLEGPVPNRASLDVTASQFLVRASGKVDTRGGDALASDARGGAGGAQAYHVRSLFVNEGTLDLGGGAGAGAGPGGAAGDGGGLTVVATLDAPSVAAGGVILNAGAILMTGGNGSSGGDAAGTQLRAPSYVVNTGRIVQQGGAGSAGRGGGGGVMELHSTAASVVNAGTLAARGGNGVRGGGPGGAVTLRAGESAAGNLINSGSITASGGDDLDDPAGATSTDASGGFGGSISLVARGSFRSSGALTADGGVGHGQAAMGGGGGTVTVALQPGAGPVPGAPMRMGALQLSGAVSSRGGACPRGVGGMGGHVGLNQQPAEAPSESDPGIDLLGYGGIVFDAGDGTTVGGAVASMFVIAVPSPISMVPAGSIVNEVDISARGGAGTGASAAASSPGSMTMAFLYWNVSEGGNGTGGDIVNSGNIDLGGGSSTGDNRGGNAQGLQWTALGSITNSGRIACRGGDAQQGRGGSGAGPGVLMTAGVDVVNRGAIDATAGAGASGGSPRASPPPPPPPVVGVTAALVEPTSFVRLLAGHQVRNAGPIAVPGGRATDAVAGVAGSGGVIDLFSEEVPTENTASCNVAPGTGGQTPGQKGTIWIDGVDRTPASGVL